MRYGPMRIRSWFLRILTVALRFFLGPNAPHRKGNARRRQHNSSNRNRDRVRRETHAEPGIVSAGIKEQSKAESEGKHITQPLPKDSRDFTGLVRRAEKIQ